MNEPNPGLTARQALIKAAVGGWAGDELCSWHCPATEETIIAMAKSHAGPNTVDFPAVFQDLVDDGLFFEVHHGVFDPPVYYCSYDPDFLEEINGSPEDKSAWKAICEENDEVYGISTWRSLGLCAGQGSEGPSDARWGPCLGTSCCCFEDGSEECTHELTFTKSQRVRCPGCRQSVLRESLRPHVQGLLDEHGRNLISTEVCPQCSNDRTALTRIVRKWRRFVSLDLTLKAFDKTKAPSR
jgi:hypothetical protein